tara:strand:- start:22734 stop:23834 length:1101 start_codon:yes stop_codon:yes gene_type:complete
MLKKYAKLLCNYSIKATKGQTVLIKTSTAAIPLVKEVYKELLNLGCYVETDLDFEDQDRLFYDLAKEHQLKKPSQFYTKAIEEFDALVRIIAPHNLKSTASVNSEIKKIHQEALAPLRKTYMNRSAKKELKWVLCIYPTQSAAQEAGMSLSEYEEFIYKGCMLDQDNPIKSWEALSASQQNLVNRLNKADMVRYVGENTDLSFSTKGRLWINSDGHYNMPSGEVFTGPIEESVNGQIYFSYPTVYEGSDVEKITLEVKNGVVKKWYAEIGQDVLDRVFSIKGANMFGEVAIGTNYAIQRATKNILFDEKIGGSVHMAIGASYPETGGKNDSAVHWDMIKDMKNGGQIFVDDELIYENGKFLNYFDN